MAEDDILRQLLQSGFNVAGPEDGVVDTSEQAKQANFMQDLMQMVMDPAIGMQAELAGLGGGIDYNQAFNLNGSDENSPVAAIENTPMLDSFRNGGDPLEAQIAQMIDDGWSASRIRTKLAQEGLDESVLGEYGPAIDSLFTEKSDVSAGRKQYESDVANAPVQQSALNEMLSEAGLPTLDQEYNREYFDPEGAQRDGALQDVLAQKTEAYQRQVRERGLVDIENPSGVVDESLAPKNEMAGMFGDAVWQGPRPNINFGDGSQTLQVDGAASPQPAQNVDQLAAMIGRQLATPASRGATERLGVADRDYQAAQSAGHELSASKWVQDNFSRRAQQATQGRTPTGDGMTQRILAMRAMGMGV